MFNIINYLDKVFIEVNSCELQDVDIPVLMYKNKYYIDGCDYLKNFYSIDTDCISIDDSDDVHLQITTTSCISAGMLSNFPDSTVIKPGIYNNAPCIKISISVSL